MRLMHWIILFPCLCFGSSNDVEDLKVTVDLQKPTFKDGVLTTDKGGVIYGPDLRIQAKHIRYLNKGKNHKIEGKGDLLVQYKGRAYLGEEVVFDLSKKTGIVHEGKTYASPWYIGGNEIELKADGSYHVQNATLTTSDERDANWDLFASQVDVQEREIFTAHNIRFRLFQVPTLWLPYFKLNLKKSSEPIFRYFMNWDKGQGPRISGRYQIYSNESLALYLRGDYRLRKGAGGALETIYQPPHGRTRFITKSFVASDFLQNNPVKKRRFRLQGEFHATSKRGKTHADITWDRYSDILMPQDFKSEDFEVNTALKTELNINHKERDLITILNVRPRMNSFQTIKQNLPNFFLTMRPLKLGKTGIISKNYLKLSYLDFKYSKELVQSLQNFDSSRLETRQEAYRPFRLGPIIFTPKIGTIGVFYGENPEEHSRGLGALLYEGLIQTYLHRYYADFKHVFRPYISYKGMSSPTIDVDQHFIFSIQDGIERLNQLTGGIETFLFAKNQESIEPRFTANLYAQGFFTTKKIPQFIPKLYLKMAWNYPIFSIFTTSAWNFRHQTLDYTNIHAKWTLNQNVAFNIEGRYRSRFDWRKADRENFILDVSRSESELLLSPLSDRRITLLTDCFFRFNPFWSCHVQSHQGWYRLNETPYNEFKIDLSTIITSNWRLQLIYTHTQEDDRVAAAISLIKKESNELKK